MRRPVDPARPARRRLVLGAPAVGALLALPAGAVTTRRQAITLGAPVPMAQLQVAEGDLVGVSGAGELWRLDRDWRRIATGLDPESPIAAGFGRIAGRGRDGGLWVFEERRESGRSLVSRRPALAPAGGKLLLAFGIIAVAAGTAGSHHLVRLDPDGAGGWSEAARTEDVVLPDARPVQVDPDGTDSDDNGHVAVLGGPDASRYQHGVLGDDVEATTLLYLERHSLRPLGRLALPAPYVFEDNRPRPISWRGRRALLTVRSGPLGGQVAIVAFAGPGQAVLELAALGEPIGTIRRWLSPTLGRGGLFAVHTPHIGGVLHRYRDAGDRLAAERLMDGVTNHVIGRHELDISAWSGDWLVLPTQDRRALLGLAIAADGSITTQFRAGLTSPSGIRRLYAWQRAGESGVAILAEDGSVEWSPVAA